MEPQMPYKIILEVFLAWLMKKMLMLISFIVALISQTHRPTQGGMHTLPWQVVNSV